MGTLERLLQRMEMCLGDQSHKMYYILYVNSQSIQRNYTSHIYTSLFCQIYIPLWIFIVNFPECRCTALQCSALLHSFTAHHLCQNTFYNKVDVSGEKP